MKLLRRFIPIVALLAIGAMATPVSASTTVAKSTFNGDGVYFSLYSDNECGQGFTSTSGYVLNGTMKDSSTGAVTRGLFVMGMSVYAQDCSGAEFDYNYPGDPVTGALTTAGRLRNAQLAVDVPMVDWYSQQPSTFTVDLAFTPTERATKYTGVNKWTGPDGTSYSESYRGSRAFADVTGSVTDGVITTDGSGGSEGLLQKVTSGTMVRTVSGSPNVSVGAR